MAKLKTTAKKKAKPVGKKATAKASPRAKPARSVRVSEVSADQVEILDPTDSPPAVSADEVDKLLDGDFDLSPESAEAGALVPSSDPMARYMSEVRRYPVLSREQEFEVAKRYRETGDRRAAEMLVTSNLRFVVKIAAEYSKFGARLIDLVQEGNVGLMHAVKEFNPYKGVRLITYAVWWIRGYIQEYLMRQYSMVRIGTTATQRKLFYQLQREKEALEKAGPNQGLTQLSGRLGVSEEEVTSMQQRLKGRDVSLDAPIGEDGSSTLADLQSTPGEGKVDEELGLREELKILEDNLEEIRPSLNEREIFLLEARLLADEPLTLQEVGDKYGITREAVRQMEARLMEKIKKKVMADLKARENE